MKKLFFGVVIVSVLALALVGLPLGMANAQTAATGTATSPKVTQAQLDATVAYWTRDRIAAAKPFPMPVDAGKPILEAPAVAMPAVTTGASAPGGAAAADADAIAMKAYAADWAMANVTSDVSQMEEAPALATGTSQVFDSYIVNSWAPAQTIYPHRWVGRLSFSTSGGTSYCSATAISNNHLVTAAHCVYDTTNNVWYSNWAFSPAYRAGAAPYGTFPASACTILTAWVNLTGSYSITGWAKYDVAVCNVGNNSAGQTLNAAVGWAGRSWDYGYVLHIFDMGYPWKDTSNVALTNAGAYLRACAAETFMVTTDTVGMGCNWGPGISGGPRIRAYYPASTGYVNGVNSGMYIGTKNMYGIRFTSSNIVPICTTTGC